MGSRLPRTIERVDPELGRKAPGEIERFVASIATLSPKFSGPASACLLCGIAEHRQDEQLAVRRRLGE